MVRLINVFAQDLRGGIGKHGRLPWKHPLEMLWFKTLTCFPFHTTAPNPCIMGKTTYESMPKAFFRESKRSSCVISRSLRRKHMPKGIKCAPSIADGIHDMCFHNVTGPYIFSLGGKQLYVELYQIKAVDWTIRSIIHDTFDCDIVMSSDHLKGTVLPLLYVTDTMKYFTPFHIELVLPTYISRDSYEGWSNVENDIHQVIQRYIEAIKTFEAKHRVDDHSSTEICIEFLYQFNDEGSTISPRV